MSKKKKEYKRAKTNDAKNIERIKDLINEPEADVTIITDGIYEANGEYFTTRGHLNNNFPPLKIGKEDNGRGLGDTLEKVFEIVGAKKVMALVKNEEDCGCDKRKRWLNQKFPTYQPNCFTADQYQLWDVTREAIRITDTVTPEQQQTIVDLLRSIFNMSVAPCRTCSGSVWKKYIQLLDAVYESYENQNLA